MSKSRSEVSKEDCWNVEGLYPNVDSWQKEFEGVCKGDQKPRWKEIEAFHGTLADSPEQLKKVIEFLLTLQRKISNLYTYAHLKHDEDITEDGNKAAYDKISSLYHDFGEETAWFEPELLSIPDDKMEKFLASSVLKDYKFHLEKLIRIKPHVLKKEQEELIALSGKALDASHKAFRAINDADFKFGKVKDKEGKELDLTHGTYGLFVRDQDRTLRKNAFLKMHGTYEGYENTLCELLVGAVQSHVFNVKARKYDSALQAALFPKNIDESVYHSLIKAVRDNIKSLHNYVDLRKNLPGVDKLHLYDMYVPLTADVDIKLTYKEAEEAVIESVAPLGSEYQNILRKGLLEDRWVDRYENKNKRSGAYSSGSYDSMPYILMNYKELLRDVFTLAHEAGHSMHSYMTHKAQPYQYGNYSIFLAEVASTFNEELLMQYLLKKCTSKEEKVFLLTQKIEDIRTTLFRQTMFAEFELWIHEMAEKDIPLTPKVIRDYYRSLNAFYFGDAVVIDKEAEVEWARIPHFYYNFYVFQYATGISAALSLAEKVVSGGDKERNDYLSFLKGGSSLYPIDMLKKAGVDMKSPEPVKITLKKFDKLVKELSSLI